jgi:hypothetical protein
MSLLLGIALGVTLSVVAAFIAFVVIAIKWGGLY